MSYDATLATERDQVRMYLGDTSNDAATELVTDAHISAVLTLVGSVAAAVVVLARELLARFAAEPERVTLPNGLSVAYNRAGWLALVTAGVGGTLAGGGAAFSVQTTRTDGYADYAAENA
jgi:hypothetical protein